MVFTTDFLGTLSRLVLDTDTRNDRINHAVLNVTKFLHKQDTAHQSTAGKQFLPRPSQAAAEYRNLTVCLSMCLCTS